MIDGIIIITSGILGMIALVGFYNTRKLKLGEKIFCFIAFVVNSLTLILGLYLIESHRIIDIYSFIVLLSIALTDVLFGPKKRKEKRNSLLNQKQADFYNASNMFEDKNNEYLHGYQDAIEDMNKYDT